jgi:hypothetical protein
MNQFPTEEEPLDVTEIRTVKRITMAQVLRSAVDAFDLDRGGIYTMKQLFIDPGKAVRDYLGANRFHYVPPFRILIVTTAIALFLIGLAEFSEQASTDFSTGYEASVQYNGGDQEKSRKAMKSMIHFFGEIQGYFNIILWTFIPFAALFSWLINLKAKFNFAEHIVFQTYLFCVSNMVSFLFPLDHILPGWVIFLVVYILILFYYIFAYKEFLLKSWLRSLFEMIFIFFFSTMFWSLLLGVAIGIYVFLDMKAIP